MPLPTIPTDLEGQLKLWAQYGQFPYQRAQQNGLSASALASAQAYWQQQTLVWQIQQGITLEAESDSEFLAAIQSLPAPIQDAGAPYVGPNAPATPLDGTIWWDTTVDLLKRWSSSLSKWIPNGSGTYAAVSALNSPSRLVDLWQFPLAAYSNVNLNSAAIAQDMVTTGPDGSVYAVFWDALKHPQVAKWSANSRAWQVYDLSNVTNNPLQAPEVGDDTHHNLTIGVDGDGYIHVAGNMHDNPLRYLKSANAGDITSWTTPGMVGTNEDLVTYPQFIRLSGGDLLLFYRNGISGNGDLFVNRYTKSTKTWARVSSPLVGTTASPAQSPYINRLAVTAGDVIHLFYVWRQGADQTTTHDISYLKSSDAGATWQTIDGTTQTLPLGPTSSAPVAVAGSYTTTLPGLINQVGASVDSNGNPHAVWWLNPSAGVSELHHIYYSGGAWHNDTVASYNTTSVNRPGCWSDGAGNTFAVYARGGYAYAQQIAPTVGTERQFYPFVVGGWEPTFDSHSPASTMRLIWAPSVSGEVNAYAGVLSVDSSILLNGAAANYIYPQPDPTVPQPNQPLALVGGLPMLVGNWYAGSGTNDASGVTPAQNEMRGALIQAGRACNIDTVGVNVLSAGGAGSTFKIVITDPSGKVIASSAAQDGTITGNRNVTLNFNLAQGQMIVAAVLCQGSATSPSFSRLTTTNDPRIGFTSLPNMFTGNNLPGLSATGISGAVPASVTYGGTGNTVKVAIHVNS